eukprot:symbB.v1.2.022951.t1/scaffold2067.1/size90749/11
MFKKALKGRLNIVFRTNKQAAQAKQLWGKGAGDARIVAMGKGGTKKGAFSSGEGEMASSFIRSLKDMGDAFVVLVAPRKPQLEAIAKAIEEVDSKTCFILLNARLRGGPKDPLREELATAFSPAFHVRLVFKGKGMVFRQLQDGSSPWILAERKLPSTIATEVSRSLEEPTPERIEEDGKGQATLICEESEDLWHLYNLSMKGDSIKAMTYRKIQKEGSTGTVQTEVKKIQMTVEVKSIEYDAAGNVIRFSGGAGFTAGDSQLAKESGHVLDFMMEQKVEVNIIHYNAAIAVCDRANLWSYALYFLQRIDEMHLSPDVFTCSCTMSACLKEQKWESALAMVNLNNSIRLDLPLANTALAAATTGSAWNVAIALLDEMPTMELRPDVISFSTTMDGFPWKKSLLLLDEMKVTMVEADRQLFNVVMCEWHISSEVLQMMRCQFCRPDIINESSSLAPLADTHRWPEALASCNSLKGWINLQNVVLSGMKSNWQLSLQMVDDLDVNKLKPDEFTFNSLSSAFSSAARWRDGLHIGQPEMPTFSGLSLAPWWRALLLLEGAKQRGLEVDRNFHGVAGTGQDSRFWERTLLTVDAQHRSGALNQVTLSTSLNAMEIASAWQMALVILGSISWEDFDEVSFGAAISAAAKGSQWEMALSLLEEMQQQRFQSTVACNSASSACERGSRWPICIYLLDGTCSNTPDVVTYNVALAASQKGRSWQLPCRLLEEMSSSSDGNHLHPDLISLDTVLLACCQQRQWRTAMAYHGDLEDHISMESLEVMITACEGQHVHHVACKCFSCQPCRIPTPEVSSHGRFRNRFGCISFGSLTSSGYLRVSIDRSMFYVHRVVAFAFLGPPPAENRWLVNHRDNNPSNNRLENLEYVSPSQNMLHSYTNSSRGTASKPVMWRTMGSQRWNMCSSGTVASQQLGVSQSSVSRCCQQKVSINGFELRFVSDGDRTIYAQEEWRPMLDTRSGEIVPGKMVSSLGRVRGKNGCVSQGYLERTGYFTTHISGFKLRNELVHRLVARAFLQPPDSPLRVQVNHRDGNKENNAAENLEYAHPSIAAAAQILGLRHSGISACINGRARRSGAYEFRLPIASAAPAFDGHTDEEWREENQWVKMGAHHTLEIELNNKLTLAKDRWDAMHLQALDDATDVHKTSEVAVLLIEIGGIAGRKDWEVLFLIKWAFGILKSGELPGGNSLGCSVFYCEICGISTLCQAFC